MADTGSMWGGAGLLIQIPPHTGLTSEDSSAVGAGRPPLAAAYLADVCPNGEE